MVSLHSGLKTQVSLYKETWFTDVNEVDRSLGHGCNTRITYKFVENDFTIANHVSDIFLKAQQSAMAVLL